MTVLPFLLMGNEVIAQERNFKSSCSYASTSGAMHFYEVRGKCQIKTYVRGDYLIVEVTNSWDETNKETIRLENDPSCDYWSWSNTLDADCKAGFKGDDNSWSYVNASENEKSFHYGMGNIYMFTYDGPLLRPASQNY